MRTYVGIDLGTTNSAVCSYDGEDIRIWKSPDQNDVTPSVIFIDRKGRRFYGMKAYNQAPAYPNNTAVLFKRFMGTDKKIELPGANVMLTPVECSAEILRVLFGYLPEEVRTSKGAATVITVPAAFNQTKKDATKRAAAMAGLGKVALMQEPVAAIMSLMKTKKQDGIFIIYDLGGGTFDVSIAENIGGKVNLLTQGGIEMCGGRDIDRKIFTEILTPWLLENFVLPPDFQSDPRYKTLCRYAERSVEWAKIGLSTQEETQIYLGEFEIRTVDLEGNEIYIDISLTRSRLNGLIGDLVDSTVEATREALAKVNLKPDDIEKIVFIGGPPNYKPLRDEVASRLGIKAAMDLNPMTAVAEGASIYAESIDWDSISDSGKGSVVSKSSGGALNAKDISFRYIARTTAESTKAVVRLNGSGYGGFTFEIVSNDTGTTTGRVPLEDKSSVSLSLMKMGENRFTVSVYDRSGQAIPLPSSTIVITRTLVSSVSIPASHSIGLEILKKLESNSVLHYLVREGDDLPKEGVISLRSTADIKAGDAKTILNINLWEGNIQFPITDNRFIGVLKISGSDFDRGIIKTGDELICNYEINNAENIHIEVSVPSIGATFEGTYSGEVNMPSAQEIAENAEEMLQRIDEISDDIDDSRLDRVREINEKASDMRRDDPESMMKMHEDQLASRRMLDEIRRDHMQVMRERELDEMKDIYGDMEGMQGILPSEIRTLERLINSAERAISLKSNEFEELCDDFHARSGRLLYWSQDWYVTQIYKDLIEDPDEYDDTRTFFDLKRRGDAYLAKADIDNLRTVNSMLLDLLPQDVVNNILPRLGDR
ncbi:MAG: Hsp70 family protein [Methanomicrobiales archaeon]|nr:Hsp70 family protein [Methanomicrobiales archaeon]